MELVAQLAPEWPTAQSFLGYVYGLTGRRAEAMKVLANLDELARKRYVGPVAQTFVYLGQGEKHLALDWLEKASEDRLPEMIWLKVDPALAPLRNEPRFQALIKRVGLDK